MPQGFVQSPSLFAEAMEKDLQMLPAQENATIIQYVDDLLVAAAYQTLCAEVTVKLLCHLDECGYKVSKSKAQLVKQEANYLGFK